MCNLIQLTCSIRLFSIMEFTIELEGFCWKHQGRYRRFNPFRFSHLSPSSHFNQLFSWSRLHSPKSYREENGKPFPSRSNFARSSYAWCCSRVQEIWVDSSEFSRSRDILSFAGSPCPTRAWNLLCENFKNGMNGFSRNWEFPINQLVTWLILKFVLPHTRKWR